MVRGHALLIYCANPELTVNFDLPPGTFARIGGSEEAEITLPLPGIRDFCGRVSRGADGLLRYSMEEDMPGKVIAPPFMLSAPPYQLVLMSTTGRPQLRPAPAPPPRTEPAPQPESRIILPPPILHQPGHAAPSQVQRVVYPDRSNQTQWKAALLVSAALVFLGICIVGATLLTRQPPNSGELTKATPPAPQPEVVREEASPPAPSPTILPSAPAPEAPPAASATAVVKPRTFDLEELVEKVEPSVFKIEVLNSYGNTIGTGSGFTISSDGLLVTNAHVIESGTKFTARSTTGAYYTDLDFINSDEHADLAILRIKSPASLPYLELGDSDALKTGASIAVFGSPAGLAGTLSEGVVSAKRADTEYAKILPNGGNLIQITAPISPGSSGSPVFDRQGKVVGVVSMLLAGTAQQNLNFAIPTTAVAVLRDKPPGSSVRKVTKRSATDDADARAKEDPINIRAELLADEEKFVEAEELAYKLVRRHPESPHAHTLLGTILMENKVLQDAEASFEKALSLNPDDYEALYLCSYAELMQDKPFEAITKARRAVKVQPAKTDGYWALVLAALGSGGTSEAIQTFEKFSAVDATSARELIEILASRNRHGDELVQFLRHFGRSPSGSRSSSADSKSATRPRETPRLTTEDFKLAFARIINRFLVDQEKADPGDELLHYDEIITPYYKQESLRRSEILRYMQNLRVEWPSRSLKLMEVIRYQSFGSGQVGVTYRVKYRFTNGGKVRQGEMTQSILLTVAPGEGWLVSGIETHQ